MDNNKNNSKKENLVSSRRDFSSHSVERLSHPNKVSTSFISFLLTSKVRYLFTVLFFSLLLLWVFLGEHNTSNIGSQEISIPEYTASLQNNELHTQSIKLPNVPEPKDVDNGINTDLNERDKDGNVNNNPEDITETVIVKKNDNLSNMFIKLKLNKEELIKIIANKEINNTLKKIKPGDKLEITYNQDTKKLSRIIYNIDKLNLFIIEPDLSKPDHLVGKIEKLDLIEKTSFAKLTINSSLFEDAQKQNLPTSLVFQLIDIFTWDVDFAQDLREGDTVEMLYKEYYLDGDLHMVGPIQAVNFKNNNQLYSAVRYEDEYGANYYTPEGLSLRKAFIRTPVKFTRISSKFSLGRNHPILHKIRAHKGVDYAAPTGTPIKAAGDGKIIHYGRKGGYGKAVVIQHGHKYSTLYAHMSKYNSKLSKGQNVKQGDIIGYVGQTGLASGPHLHFEFRVDGIHQNPLTVPLPKAKHIDKKHKIKFIDDAQKILATLDKFIQHNDNRDNVQFALNTNFE